MRTRKGLPTMNFRIGMTTVNKSTLPADKRPKAVEGDTRCKLTWVIAASGECIIGFSGESFMAFRDAAGAAWTLRQWADGIERDGEDRKKAST